jgi:hypothetical protein
LSSAPGEATLQEGEICIDASQLRPGVHVRLPVSWVKHQFMFSSFVIENEEQARLIAAMKLPQLFCDPARCKVPPRPLQEAVTPPDHDADQAAQSERDALAALEAARMDARRERERMMEGLRQRLLKAGQHYRGAAATVSSAIRGFSTNPQQSVKDFNRTAVFSGLGLAVAAGEIVALVGESGRRQEHAAQLHRRAGNGRCRRHPASARRRRTSSASTKRRAPRCAPRASASSSRPSMCCPR